MDAIIKYTRKVPIWKTIIGFGAIAVGLLGLISLWSIRTSFSVTLLFGFNAVKNRRI